MSSLPHGGLVLVSHAREELVQLLGVLPGIGRWPPFVPGPCPIISRLYDPDEGCASYVSCVSSQ